VPFKSVPFYLLSVDDGAWWHNGDSSAQGAAKMSIRALIKTVLNGSMAGAGGAAAVLAVGFGGMQIIDYRVDVRAGQIKQSIQREFNRYVLFDGRGVVVHDSSQVA
jgi:hypothetical protein